MSEMWRITVPAPQGLRTHEIMSRSGQKSKLFSLYYFLVMLSFGNLYFRAGAVCIPTCFPMCIISFGMRIKKLDILCI
jgi:hypothetical protein